MECDAHDLHDAGYVPGFNPRTPYGVRRQQYRRSAGLTCSFNPRTPYGVRLVPGGRPGEYFLFQSTHSVWSATEKKWDWEVRHEVSIHALRMECDKKVVGHVARPHGFNPRTPYGVRPSSSSCPITHFRFQSTHSVWSATAYDHMHCYSTAQTILCANLPEKTVIARSPSLGDHLSIFNFQRVTPIAGLPGNLCELGIGAKAVFNSL